MILELDRNRFLENLQYRMGVMGYTATALENEIGVYGGYIARMKSDPQKLPALDIAYRMAQALDVNIQWLIEGSAIPESDDSVYTRRFLDRLFEMTHRGTMQWSLHTYGEINDMITGKRPPADLPLLQRNNGKEKNPYGIRSLAQPDYDGTIAGDAYCTPLDENSTVWIMPLKGTIDLGPDEDNHPCEWIEMLLQDRMHPTEASLIISDVMPGGDFLIPVMKKLMNEIRERAGDLSIDRNVKKVLDAFMERSDERAKGE